MKRYMVGLVLIVVISLIAGCNKEPKPEDRFSQYVKLWNDRKFEEMYDYLSSEAKSQVTQEDFVGRYTKIYSDLQIHNLAVEFVKPEEETKTKEPTIEFPFSASMESLAGEIAFDHQATLVKEERDEEENWFVDWNTTFIFPELKDGDKIGLSSSQARRGSILDKNGEGLAINGIAYEVGVVPKDMEGKEDKIIAALAKELDIKEEQIEKALNASWVKPEHFVPIKKISKDDQELKEKVFIIPSVLKRDVEAREYPFGEAAAHLIGYVGPITAEELEKRKDKGYTSQDLIGKRGLEQVLDEQLKGENGSKIVIKKEDGTEVLLAEKEVKNGQDIKLTIDAHLQEKIYEELKGEAGTAAAMHPITGETLALVSSPSFNPNILALGGTANQWKALQENELDPLLSRFKYTYAPGSVIKPIVAAIGLSEGATDWEKTMLVDGKSWRKDRSWGNYSVTRVTDPKGPVNLDKALLYSDNIYFAQTALDLGKNKFAAGLEKFGFGEKTNYLYPLEPSKYGKLDTEVQLADSGYGQGQMEMSMVHLAATYTPFVNKGNMIKPVLLADKETNQVWKEAVVSEEEARNISDSLKKVVEDPSGTAYMGRIEGYPLAGKTGTAEFKAKQGEKGKENGLFVAYNTEKPEILIALMVEGVEDKGGSKVAVQMVRNVLAR